jgi:cytochrome c oxidase subunit IV
MTELSQGALAAEPGQTTDDHQQHPLKVYFIVWGWLFVLSACSYFVDFVGFQGLLRWTLILLFMMAKASLIVAFFMHLKWERQSLSWAMLLPPVAVLAFVGIIIFEASYTLMTREVYFDISNVPGF